MTANENPGGDNPYREDPYETEGSNPYAAPVTYTERPSGNPLIIPAIFILVFASLYFLMFVLSLPQQIANMREIDTSTPRGMGEMFGQGLFLVGVICCSLLEAFGAVCMLRMRRYGFAMASAILALIPVCSPCFFLGIPFGIWALVVLSQAEVRQRFEKR